MDAENMALLRNALARLGRESKVDDVAFAMDQIAQETGMHIDKVVMTFYDSATYVGDWAIRKLQDEFDLRLLEIMEEKPMPFALVKGRLNL